MARFVYAAVVCLVAEFVSAFPGSMLRGRWPPAPLAAVRLPPQIHQIADRLPEFPRHLPEGMPESHIRFRFPDQVRDVVMCCKALTAECLACATNQDVTQFCADQRRARIPGCQRVLDTAIESSREQALDGMFDKVVEKAAEMAGGGGAEQIADNYLETHPGMARKNLVNLTGEAFDALSSIKNSLLHRKGEAAVPTRKRPHSSHTMDESEDMDELQDEIQDELQNELEEDEGIPSMNLGPIFNPFFLALSALLITAISTGVAVGALCHARIQTRAREPLLSTLLQGVEPQAHEAESA